MSRERVTFYYDSIDDSDIHKWIEELPQRGKSTFIKKAIREYIQKDESVSLSGLEGEKLKELEQRVQVLEKHLKHTITMETKEDTQEHDL